jgi:hypothetical protein
MSIPVITAFKFKVLLQLGNIFMIEELAVLTPINRMFF